MITARSKLLRSNIESWRRALGLLPVPLAHASGELSRYVLLNGNVGNFCLDLGPVSMDAIARCSSAWSSNVGHYVTFASDFVEVHRWNAPDRSEKYTTESVTANIERFHRHLESHDPGEQNSIVQHSINAFRTLRNAMADDADGFHSVDAFLYLLACVSAGETRDTLNFAQWGLDAKSQQAACHVESPVWDDLFERMLGVGSFRNLKPDYSLVFRHAAGALFQEAHFQAQVSRQVPLFGAGTASIPTSTVAVGYEGAYFTPQPLARTLAEEALSALDLSVDSLTIFDPACGSGELLKETLRILELRNYTGQINLIGWDISSAAVRMARFILNWEARQFGARLTFSVEAKDSLASVWPRNASLIIMNPPFKSWVQMDTDEREKTSQLMGNLQFNRPNMAALFANLAVEALDDDGVLAMVSPNSMFESTSAKKLRDKIDSILSPALIARLGSQSLFHNAVVDAGLYIGKRTGTPSHGVMIVWSDYRAASSTAALRALRKRGPKSDAPIVDNGYSVYRRPKARSDSSNWVARSYESWMNFEKARGSALMVAAEKLFDIRQGCRLGDDAFVIEKSFYAELGTDEKKYFRPAVLNLSIDAGVLNDSLYVFFPYSEDFDRITTEDALRDAVPTYYRRVLQLHQTKLSARKSIRAGYHWWDLSEPRSNQIARTPKIVSKYFGNEGAFAWDDSGDFVVVVGYAWIPTVKALQQVEKIPEYQQALVAYLNGAPAQQLISYLSLQVGGGQWDLSKRFLAELPIPNPAKTDRQWLISLAKMANAASDNEEDNTIKEFIAFALSKS